MSSARHTQRTCETYVALTISPNSTTFSPRMRKSPRHASAKTSWWYIRSTVSSRTRLAAAHRLSTSLLKTSVQHGTHRIDHTTSRPLEASAHLAEPRASSLTGAKRTNHGVGSGDWQGIWAQGAPRVGGLRIDVLSTQSTRDPEVVNGIRESIADGHPGRAEEKVQGFRPKHNFALPLSTFTREPVRHSLVQRRLPQADMAESLRRVI